MEYLICGLLGYAIGRYVRHRMLADVIKIVDDFQSVLTAELAEIRTIADDAQRTGDRIMMGNALLRIRRMLDGVEE